MDRLFEAMGMIKEDLSEEFKSFLDKLEEISQEVNYLDVNDYEKWTADKSSEGLMAYLSEQMEDFIPKDPEKYVVLWVNEDCDRNADGEVIGGYEEGYYPTLKEAVAAAEESASRIEAGREIVIAETTDFSLHSGKEPFEIIWTNQPERYMDEIERE